MGTCWPFWPLFDPLGALKRVKTCILPNMNATIEIIVWNNKAKQHLNIYKLFVRRWVFFEHFDPRMTPGCSKRVESYIMSKMNATIKFLVCNNIPTQILSIYKLFVGRWALVDHFDPRLTPVGLKKRVKSYIMSKMNASIKFLVCNNIPTQILSIYKLFVGRWALVDHFEPRLIPEVLKSVKT